MNKNPVQSAVFQRQVSYCGKPRCPQCGRGEGHGPYWYEFVTEGRQTTRIYRGKTLPADIERKIGPLSPLETTIVQLVGGDGTSFHLPLTERQYTHFKNVEALGPVEGSTFAERLVELFCFVKEHGHYPPLPQTLAQKGSILGSDTFAEGGWTPGGPATIRAYTLGVFRIERRDTTEWLTVTDHLWYEQRVQALLGYLLSMPRRRARREQIGAAIWPSLKSDQAIRRLDSAEHHLRQVFEPAREQHAQSSYLFTEGEMLVLADQQHLWVDADAFGSLITQAGYSDAFTEKESLLEEALTLYRGDFLPSERTVEITLERRESLRRLLTGLFFDLAELCIQRESLSEAIYLLGQLLSKEPTHEAAAQRLREIRDMRKKGTTEALGTPTFQ